MTKEQGNLISLAFQNRFEIIAHGCNCFHTMGAGIAATIRTKFPSAYEADLKTPYGDRNKLGTFSYAEIPDNNLIVANLYTQFRWGKTTRHETKNDRYTAISNALTNLKNFANGKPTGIPKIGAGLAGGDWNIIEQIIEEKFPEVTVVEFNLSFLFS